MNTQSTGISPQDIEAARLQIARALGLSHLALDLGAEVVDVVERMHGTISRAPLPWQSQARDRASGLSGLIYRLIHGSFSGLSQAMAQASLALDNDHAPSGQWLQVRAAINGVCGDRLAQQQSPLALSMQLLPDAQDPAEVDAPTLVLIHGLCMSELGWHNPACEDFARGLKSHGAWRVQALRYNSGLHISDNARALSHLLETRLAEARSIQLVGHSMGGLLARAALLSAAEQGHQWPHKLNLLACLGSPHHGAPLERIGNHANRLLQVSPYLKPFARLGALRSAGIQDLRHGLLRESDWHRRQQADEPLDLREPAPLPATTRTLFIAGCLSAEPGSLGGEHDYLVPVDSAFGQARDAAHTLQSDQLQRHLLPATHHLELLRSEAVFKLLADALQSRPAPARLMHH